MPRLRVSVRNYRCLGELEPAEIEIGAGLTALVGPNNSGKSAFLKLFYEMRHLFGHLASHNNFIEAAHGKAFQVNVQGVEDILEIASDRNDRSIVIQIDVLGVQQDAITRAVLEAHRTNLSAWTLRAVVPRNNARVTEIVPTDDGRWRITAAQTQYATTAADLLDGFAMLAASLYVGPFRNAMTETSGAHYDLTIGTGFIQQWHELKTGGSRHANQRARWVEEEIARIFGFQSVEINAAVGGSILQVRLDGRPYRLRELGAGIAQFIVLLGNLATRQPRLVLIDEPELHLHPTLQLDFLSTVASLASDGVVFSTHALALARASAERIVSLRRAEGVTRIRPFEQTPHLATFLGEMGYSAHSDLGVETVLLVEGVTDVLAVQQWLRILHLDHRVMILPLGGGQMIHGGRTAELAELQRVPQVAVLIDSERTAALEPLTAAREAFLAECRALGFQVHATERRAFENYLSERAIQEEKGPAYTALTPFALLRDAAKPWSKSDNWRIARRMTAAEVRLTDVGRFLAGLCPTLAPDPAT